MPCLSLHEVGIAFDMYGCPNRCRHCFLGDPPDRHVSEEEVRQITGQFRGYRRSASDDPFFKELVVSTWLREPDFAHNYQYLSQLEEELSTGTPRRFELLSIWRLVRDKSYVEWAKSVGPDTCQITFFGEEKTTDWFCRREGAFHDNLVATERLLEVGMKPRWQIFASTRGIPEFYSLINRVDTMRLRQRVEAIGGEFDMFVHTPGPDGRAVRIESLRPTVEDMQAIPKILLELSRKHFNEETLWHSEADLCDQILHRGPQFPYALWNIDMPWFLVTGNLDVFSNMQGREPWWKLGNFKIDPVDLILRRFEDNDTLGWKTIHTVSPKELVNEYGDMASRRAYFDADDLLSLYVTKYCQDHFAAAG